MIDPAYIWPDDRFELLSRLSCAFWTNFDDLLSDLGWSRDRLDRAVTGIRELQIALRSSPNAIMIAPRSKSLVFIAIAGYEQRMDESDLPDWYAPVEFQFESESLK